MNTNTPAAAQPKMEVARKIDEIAAKALEIFNGADMDFEKELAVAQAMTDMRALLTPQAMAPVMALMNSPLGFLTDRDPKNQDRNGNAMTPYGVDVVRDCVIESKLRGYHVVGNEFNIISGRFYAAKNGIRRKVTTFKGVTDFKDTYEVPRVIGDKGAIVKCRAVWKKDGIADALDREIPVKVNSFMGSDAILGKAERKLLKSVHDRLSGTITPDGEVDEDDIAPVREVPATAKPAFGTDTTAKPSTTTAPKTEPKSRIPSKKEQAMEWLLERKGQWLQVQQLMTEQDVPGADSAATADDFCNNMNDAAAGWIVAQRVVLEATLNKSEAK